jgi:hypothetical protein
MGLREIFTSVEDAEERLATTHGSCVWVAARIAHRVRRSREWSAHPAGVRCGVEAVAFVRLTPRRVVAAVPYA